MPDAEIIKSNLTLKDKYTCQRLVDLAIEGEDKKIIVSEDTYALLDAKDDELILLEKIRLGFNG